MASVSGRAFQVVAAGGDFELVQREFPDPGPGQVRIRVQACGVCHSDSVTKFGLFPGIQYPRVPGHEVAGVLDAVGADVPLLKVGQRVGLGWHGGHCNYCEQCRRGEFIVCQNQQISGISYDGGYADYVIAPANVVALVPDDMSDLDAAPLMCAGVTTFNSSAAMRARGWAIRWRCWAWVDWAIWACSLRPKEGFRTVAVARGADNAPMAKQLVAHVYIDSTTQDVAAELQKLGGADVILSTLTDAAAMAAAVNGLAPQGKLILLGVPEKALEINAVPMILGEQTVKGWPSGTAMDSQDTLEFSVLTGVKPKIETYPLEKAPEAFDRMMSGKARFRVVLQTGA